MEYMGGLAEPNFSRLSTETTIMDRIYDTK